jgi:biopolymer transport protein ExbB
MLRRPFRGIALAILICGLIAGAAHAESRGRQVAESSDVPYLYVFVVKSGPITWFIQIPMSVITLGLIIRYGILIRRKNLLPEETLGKIREHFQAKQYREAMEFASDDASILGRVVSAGLHQAAGGFAAMQRAVSEQAEQQSVRLMRQLELLNIIGNISPMIGLFGTVTGMIFAFWALVDIVQKGGMTDAAQLAAGIMYALGTTFWGLLIAIPALAAFSWFRSVVDKLTDETEQTASEFIEVFRPGARK